MNGELKIGKYEFYLYEDKPKAAEYNEDRLEELKKLLSGVKNGKSRKDDFDKLIKRQKKKMKK